MGGTVFMQVRASDEITHLKSLQGRLQILSKRYFSSLSLLLTTRCSLYFHVNQSH